MNTCARLFHADNVNAYYSDAHKQVVISADVTMNPYSDNVHICPNLLAMPAERSFIVEGVTRPGIHPMIAVKRTIHYNFNSDLTPKSVFVFVQGIDAPARLEIPVGGQPPVAAVSSTAAPASTDQALPGGGSTAAAGGAAGHGGPSKGHVPAEIIGFSETFSFDEALHDAINQARAKFPAPATRNPDVGIRVEVKEIYASVDGNMRHGLFLKTTAG